MDINELYDLCHTLFLYTEGNLIRKISVAPNAREGDIAGGIDKSEGYFRVKIKRKSYLTHRIIYFMMTKELPEVVDHIDGNILNNNFTNLRAATKMQNRWNCLPNKNTISGIKGVYWENNIWVARISVNDIRYELGRFKNINDAEIVVKNKYKELQGIYTKQ